MSSDAKPLWLVQPRLDAAEYRDKLIGSVVKYPDLPLERRIPYKSGLIPREILPDLDPKPVQVRNVKFWTRNIRDAHVSASVNEILESFAEIAKEDKTEKLATVARVWHMDSPGEKFKELLRNKQYFDELFDLLRSNHNQAYFITDIVTLTNLEMTDETSRKRGAGAGAQIPIDPSFGVDVHARAKFSIIKEKGYSACYDEESIVFLGYRLVHLEKVTGARAKLSRVFLGQKHGFSIQNGTDYRPVVKDRPVEGNVQSFMGDRTSVEEDLDEKDHLAMVQEMGYDFEIVG